MSNAKRLAVGLLTILLVALSGGCRIPPTSSMLSGPSSSLGEPHAAILIKRIYMIDALVGWAITDSGLARTADGGHSWTNITPEGLVLDRNFGENNVYSGVYFLDSEYGWVVDSNGSGSVVRGTRDGGKMWFTGKQIPIDSRLMAIDFVDAMHGWIMASHGLASGSEPVDILRTSDGGVNWELLQSYTMADQPGALYGYGPKTGIVFRNEQDGWVSVEQRSANKPGLLRTTNGGRSWVPQVLPTPPNMKILIMTVSPPVFATANSGIMSVYYYLDGAENYRLNCVYVTNDGGESWSYTADLGPPALENTPARVFFFNGLDVWAWEKSANGLFYSPDRGVTWQRVEPLPKINHISFVASTTGWAMVTEDNQHRLFSSNTSWRTWQLIY